MIQFDLAAAAVPAVVCFQLFLSVASQFLLARLEPGPLTRAETIRFNILNFAFFFCYARTCLTKPYADVKVEKVETADSQEVPRRWCRKCEAVKQPRVHHCKTCKRCIPKMDHHCPWTGNCVSHFTFPHFVRFLLYSVAGMAYLEYFLFVRIRHLWANRMMPSYLGPSAFQLVHLLLLVVSNSIAMFMLTILLIRSLWSLVVNTYTIEGWEIERHEAVLRRARYLGGYLDGPNGVKVKVVRQEFPYDIGIWKNLKQGMGTGNVLAWFWPFARTLPAESAVDWETNGFEDPKIGWPPVDPDRMPRFRPNLDAGDAFTHTTSATEDIEAFRQRQLADQQRWAQSEVQRRRPFAERFTKDLQQQDTEPDDLKTGEGEESWRNSEGERLGDFGVDEDVEFYDDDNIPLAELILRKATKEATHVQ